MDFQTDMDMEPGTFYDLSGGFFLPTKSLPFKTSLTADQRLPAQSMFDIYLAHLNGERVGFYFTCRFQVTNGGGYLITALQNKGPATEVETLIKTVDLVVYNYPNRGTLAITPLVNQEIETIFEEQ